MKSASTIDRRSRRTRSRVLRRSPGANPRLAALMPRSSIRYAACGKGKTQQARSRKRWWRRRCCDGVPARRSDVLGDQGRVRNYRKATYLCHQGDPADEVFFLLNGRVEIASVSVTGNRVLHATVDTPAVRRRARRARRDRSDGERADARGLGGLGRVAADEFLASSRASPPLPGASCAPWRARWSRTRRSSTTCSSSISRGGWPSGCCRWRPRRWTTSRMTGG